MALFQSAPRTPEEVEASAPLAISPDAVREMDEATWYAKVRRPDHTPQLTLRALAMGSVLGFLLAFTNLYVGLMTGWGLGVAITACILSYGVWTVFQSIGLARTPLTILENNCMQSTASSAGYATGSTIVSAMPALLMLSATPENPAGAHLPVWELAAWTASVAGLGVTLAIPMKRNLINQERLTFPSGTAAAITLHSLYSSGAEALQKAKALAGAAIVSALAPLLTEMNAGRSPEGDRVPLLPAQTPIFDGWLPVRGVSKEGAPLQASEWNMAFDHNPVMLAAGLIMGVRITFWMLVGAVVLVYGLGPAGLVDGWVSPVTNSEIFATTAPHKAWKEVGLWFGVSLMVSGSLTGFALQWRTIARALSGLTAGFRGKKQEDPVVEATEVPTSWFVGGMLFFGSAVVALARYSAGVPVHYGLLAVVMTFVLSLVAARATGESDVTPVGAMGKIMQLTYGTLMPQSVTANIMTANITSNASSAAADLLNDLKSGYLLGASPRRQFVAQAAGIVTGTIATTVGFRLLVSDATALTGGVDGKARFPAPAAQAWKAVADLFKYGIEGMHPTYLNLIAAGLVVGVVVSLAEAWVPKKWKAAVPSATGLGLGCILSFNYPLSMFVGACIGWLWERKSPLTAEALLVPIASGVIAGVSLMGVLVALLNLFVFGA
jgi:uncharacterized oligopeptide transporter (OPT) family protein